MVTTILIFWFALAPPLITEPKISKANPYSCHETSALFQTDSCGMEPIPSDRCEKQSDGSIFRWYFSCKQGKIHYQKILYPAIKITRPEKCAPNVKSRKKCGDNFLPENIIIRLTDDTIIDIHYQCLNGEITCVEKTFPPRSKTEEGIFNSKTVKLPIPHMPSPGAVPPSPAPDEYTIRATTTRVKYGTKATYKIEVFINGWYYFRGTNTDPLVRMLGKCLLFEQTTDFEGLANLSDEFTPRWPLVLCPKKDKWIDKTQEKFAELIKSTEATNCQVDDRLTGDARKQRLVEIAILLQYLPGYCQYPTLTMEEMVWIDGLKDEVQKAIAKRAKKHWTKP
jgi:hypothetical protein